VLAVLAVVLLVVGLMPFRFLAVPHTFYWVPFSDILEGDWQTSLLTLLRKSYWYGALIVLAREAGAGVRGSLVAVAAGLAVIELAQVFLPGRISSTTDPALAMLLGFVLLARRA
jgi:hypothetical protein